MVTFFYIVSALLTDVQFAARIRMKICRLFFTLIIYLQAKKCLPSR